MLWFLLVKSAPWLPCSYVWNIIISIVYNILPHHQVSFYKCIAHHHCNNLIINADNLHYHHGCSSKSFISLSAHSNSALSPVFHSNQKQSWQKNCKTIYILHLKSYILRLYITFYLLHLTILHSGLSSIQIRIRVSKKALQPGKLWFGPNYFLSPLWKWRSTLDLCCDFVKKEKNGQIILLYLFQTIV